MRLGVHLGVPRVEGVERSRHARDGGRKEGRLTEHASGRRDSGLDVRLEALKLEPVERLTKGGDLVDLRGIEVHVKGLRLREDSTECIGQGEELTEDMHLILQSAQPLRG